MAFLFWSWKDSKKGEKQSEKLIPIFLTVAQDKTYKISVTNFVERFYENIWTKYVNDSCQKETPGRGKLSKQGRI